MHRPYVTHAAGISSRHNRRLSMSRSVRRSLRVLYCTDTYPPQVNGVSVVTALSVAGLRARGWKVAVVAPRYPDGANQINGAVDALAEREVVGIPSLAFPPYPDIRLAAPSYPRLSQVVDRFKPDIIHSATEFMIGRLGQIAASRAGIVRLSSYHTDFSRYTEAYGVPWLRNTVSGYIGRFHRRSACVYTPSAPACDDLRAMGVLRARVWGRGVDIAAFSPERRSQPLRAAMGVDQSVVFLHVGRLAAEKGVDVIIRAFALARELLPARAAKLVIAGTGPEEASLRDMAGPDVSFLGVLDRAKALPRLYASADAFLFSSLTETLGLVVLEAMSSGLPVVATPAGGVGDHLRDGENGIAIGPRDVDGMAKAIVTLTLSADHRRRLGAGAIATAHQLDWDLELDRLDESYREILEEAGPLMPLNSRESA